MSIIDSGVRLRANDETHSLAGNRDLAGLEVAVYNDGNMGLETVATDHVLALPAHVQVGGTEKAFRAYVGESLGSGYWQGGNFGYIHQWDIAGNKPLLYQYPFGGAGIDLDFPTVENLCSSSLGGAWWLGVGGWFEIERPTWTDPTWDWYRHITYYTDKTKCNGVVYAYRIGATYYVRIWTLANGVWGYVTHSGWGGIDYNLERSDFPPATRPIANAMWEWDGDVYYIISNYYKNGVEIKSSVASSIQEVSGEVLVSNSFSYLRHRDIGCSAGLIASKIDLVGQTSMNGVDDICLIDPDKCLMIDNDAFYPGTKWKYQYVVGSTLSPATELPTSPYGLRSLDGGEDGKALLNSNNSYDYALAGFDPVANTWIDYGRPWG